MTARVHVGSMRARSRLHSRRAGMGPSSSITGHIALALGTYIAHGTIPSFSVAGPFKHMAAYSDFVWSDEI